MRWLCAAAVALVCVYSAWAQRSEVLRNRGFENGAEHWHLQNDWYASPKGSKASRCVIDKDVFREGSASLRIDGENNRGLAIQTPIKIKPGAQYRISGWVKAENLAPAFAQVGVEFWKTGEGYWRGGKSFGKTTGTTDWRPFTGSFYVPTGADYIKVYPCTSSPNKGKAWFDELSIQLDLPPPAVEPRILKAPDGKPRLDWSAYRAPDNVAYYRVYASDRPFSSVALTAAVVWRPAHVRFVHLDALPRAEYLAVTAVDEQDQENPQVNAVEVKP